MGGHGRALDILATLVKERKSSGGLQTIEAVSLAVQEKLRSSYSRWVSVQPVEALLEAIVSRRPFNSLEDIVTGTIKVDDVLELGLVQWSGSVSMPGPLIAPVILLLMLKSSLPGNSLLYHLASGYNKLEFGTKTGTWWQDFEEFLACFRAVKVKAFQSAGFVPLTTLHYGAKLSTAARAMRLCSPASASLIAVVHSAKQYSSKSSAAVRSIRPKAVLLGVVQKNVSIVDGTVIVLNGTTSASAGDVFLNITVANGLSRRIGREICAYRNRETDVSADDFELERRKAADNDDLFLLFTTKSVNIDLEDPSVAMTVSPLQSSCEVCSDVS
jgi:hypothetical protein